MYQSKYVFPCKIISGRRITIPDSVYKALELKKGQTLKITFELDKPNIKGIVI